MTVWVHTVDGDKHDFDDARAEWDTTVLQVVQEGLLYTFPLANVVYFVTEAAS